MTKEWEQPAILGKLEDFIDPSGRIAGKMAWGHDQVISFRIPEQSAAILGGQQVGLLVGADVPDRPWAERRYSFEPARSFTVPYTLQLKQSLAFQPSEEQRWTQAINSLQLSLYSVNQQLASLRDEIRELRATKVFVSEITTLSPEPFEILRPIPVTIEGGGDNFTATYFEANVSASGDTESDAIVNFKDSLISKYEILESAPENTLGPLPRRQWEILRTVIRRMD